MEVKSNEPKLTQKLFFKQLGYSDTFIKRYRDDIQRGSPYNRDKYRKKNMKSNTPETRTQSITKNEKVRKVKNNKKNDLKGGSVSENNQENITKFITLANKMIDNNYISLYG